MVFTEKQIWPSMTPLKAPFRMKKQTTVHCLQQDCTSCVQVALNHDLNSGNTKRSHWHYEELMNNEPRYCITHDYVIVANIDLRHKYCSVR